MKEIIHVPTTDGKNYSIFVRHIVTINKEDGYSLMLLCTGDSLKIDLSVDSLIKMVIG